MILSKNRQPPQNTQKMVEVMFLPDGSLSPEGKRCHQNFKRRFRDWVNANWGQGFQVPAAPKLEVTEDGMKLTITAKVSPALPHRPPQLLSKQMKELGFQQYRIDWSGPLSCGPHLLNRNRAGVAVCVLNYDTQEVSGVLIHHHPHDKVLTSGEPPTPDALAHAWSYPLEGGLMRWDGQVFTLVNTLDLKWLRGWNAPGLELRIISPKDEAGAVDAGGWQALTEAALSKGATHASILRLADRLFRLGEPQHTLAQNWLPMPQVKILFSALAEAGRARMHLSATNFLRGAYPHHPQEREADIGDDFHSAWKRTPLGGSLFCQQSSWKTLWRSPQGERPFASMRAEGDLSSGGSMAKICLPDVHSGEGDPRLDPTLRLQIPEEAANFVDGWVLIVNDLGQEVLRTEEGRIPWRKLWD
jgi:hypothetical protein